MKEMDSREGPGKARTEIFYKIFAFSFLSSLAERYMDLMTFF